nr:MAG TPA: hypothetical protein [Caudoviricetes sp.]
MPFILNAKMNCSYFHMSSDYIFILYILQLYIRVSFFFHHKLVVLLPLKGIVVGGFPCVLYHIISNISIHLGLSLRNTHLHSLRI